MTRNLEHKIEITAKPAVVWGIIMDFDKYPEWNPMVVKIANEPIVGSRLAVQIKVGDRDPMKINPLVLVNDKEKELRWVGTWVLACLVRGEHYFRIEETPTGCTVYHGEDFTGIMVGIVLGRLGDALVKAYEDYNVAIKLRAENMTTT